MFESSPGSAPEGEDPLPGDSPGGGGQDPPPPESTRGASAEGEADRAESADRAADIARAHELDGQYQSIVVGVIGKMLGTLRGRVDAMDVYQEAMSRTLQNGPRGLLADGDQFVRFLITVARNIVRDLHELHARHGQQRDVAEAEPTAPSTESPSRETQRRELGELVRLAIQRVPKDDRILIELNVFARCTPAEIAERLGMTADAVRKRLAKIRNRLRRELGPLLDFLGEDEVRDRRSEDPDP